MNFRVIIHALILLFILHIIIINIDYEVNIGKKIENFTSNLSYEKSLDIKTCFLLRSIIEKAYIPSNMEKDLIP